MNRELVPEPAPYRLPDLIKFPRTRHLVDMGSGTRDDLRMTDSEARTFLALGSQAGYSVKVEEKLDGANLGFSIDEATGMICAQNRSHYVNSTSHTQFKRIPAYIAERDAGIRKVCVKGRVLYGEWLYATHSVEYTHLPGYFLAFDIYVHVKRAFLSRAALRRALDGTEINIVPEFRIQATQSELELEQLVRVAHEEKSAYGDTPIEGLYVRLDMVTGWWSARK